MTVTLVLIPLSNSLQKKRKKEKVNSYQFLKNIVFFLLTGKAAPIMVKTTLGIESERNFPSASWLPTPSGASSTYSSCTNHLAHFLSVHVNWNVVALSI
jgi:hypothetical protein